MDDRFVNPYTFVPLPKGGAKRSDCTEATEPVFSGEIKCRLITKTQIAVPDILKNPVPDNVERTEPKKYDFFTLNGKAAIPGSGIRGVIRSVYEVLTDSCMHLNDKDDDYFHTRMNKPYAGIITYDPASNKYFLHKSERVRDKTGSDYKTGDKVVFNSKPGKKGASDLVSEFLTYGSSNGVYLRPDTFGEDKKSNPSVFKWFEDEEDKSEIDVKFVKRLKANVEMYKGKHKGDYEKTINEMENGEGWLPVWYYRDPDTRSFYFAPSQCSRSVFNKTSHDVVKAAKVNACVSPENCCEACALFGFISNENHNSFSRASRVRFTDAVCDSTDCFDGPYLLPLLANPRLSSFEFYLSGNYNKREWNRLYGPDSSKVTIAGRKFYWHAPQNVITSDDEKAEEQPTMAARMQLVKKGMDFSFSVFFDRITEKQLRKLVFALDLGENSDDSRRCHKLGHGKPVGLGSVKIIVDQIITRSFVENHYSLNDITKNILSEANEDMFPKTPVLTAFLDKLLDLDYVAGYDVDYPRLKEGGDVFSWFSENRDPLASKTNKFIKVQAEKRMESYKRLDNKGYIIYYNHLPRITDPDPSLPRKPKPGQNGGQNSGGNKGSLNNRK